MTSCAIGPVTETPAAKVKIADAPSPVSVTNAGSTSTGTTVKLADRGYVLENGRVVLEDTGDALLANEAVRSAYLGG